MNKIRGVGSMLDKHFQGNYPAVILNSTTFFWKDQNIHKSKALHKLNKLTKSQNFCNATQLESIHRWSDRPRNHHVKSDELYYSVAHICRDVTIGTDFY